MVDDFDSDLAGFGLGEIFLFYPFAIFAEVPLSCLLGTSHDLFQASFRPHLQWNVEIMTEIREQYATSATSFSIQIAVFQLWL